MVTQPPVNTLSARYVGNSGSGSRYYWVQAIYPSGRSVLSAAAPVLSVGPLSTGVNQIGLSWTPVPGAIGYDVVVTASSTIPTLNSTTTIALAFGVTGPEFTDNGQTLQSWTYESGNGGTFTDFQVGVTQITSGNDNRIVYQAAGLVAEDAGLAYDGTTFSTKAASFAGLILATGELKTSKNVAPSDGSLSANQLAIWFDPTNAAGKLMIKAKTADGTVVTGSVTLT